MFPGLVTFEGVSYGEGHGRWNALCVQIPGGSVYVEYHTNHRRACVYHSRLES